MKNQDGGLKVPLFVVFRCQNLIGSQASTHSTVNLIGPWHPNTQTGASNDSFLLNTLKTLFRLSRVVLDLSEKHCKWRYKICICSVILGELESFRNYIRSWVLFSRKCLMQFDVLRKWNNLGFASPSHFWIKKTLGFLFSTKNSLTWEVKYENFTLENRREFIT